MWKLAVKVAIVLVFCSQWFSCVDPVQLPARSVASRLVVEGLITNESMVYAVKLSLTGAYNSLIYGQSETAVSGALVTITEQFGRSVQLNQDPVTPLYYWTKDSSFVGRVGKSYQLKVQLPDGAQYISDWEPLMAVPAIDRVYAEYRPRADTDFTGPDHYEVLLDTKDPSETGNYYRWSGMSFVPRLSTGEPQGFAGVCCNYCWVPSYGTPTNVMSDILINGNKVSRKPVLSSPVYYVGRHYVEIRQFSLTRSAYQFWVKFEEQRTRNGSLFDPLPASIEGNIHDAQKPDHLALGYFGASAVSTQRIIIPGDTLNVRRLEIKYSNVFVDQGNCMLVYNQGNMSPPHDW